MTGAARGSKLGGGGDRRLGFPDRLLLRANAPITFIRTAQRPDLLLVFKCRVSNTSPNIPDAHKSWRNQHARLDLITARLSGASAANHHDSVKVPGKVRRRRKEEKSAARF